MDMQDLRAELNNLMDNVSPLQHIKDNMIANFDELKESLQDPTGKGLENLAHTANRLGHMAEHCITNPSGYLGALSEKLAEHSHSLLDKSDALQKLASGSGSGSGGISALKGSAQKNVGDLKNIANSVKGGNFSEAASNIKQGVGNAAGSISNMAKMAGSAAIGATSDIGGKGGAGHGDQMADDFANEAKKMANDAKNVAKGAVAIGRIAAGDITAAKDLLNPEVIKALLKAAMIAMAIPFIILASIIIFCIVLIKWFASSIAGALLKIFEAFNINDIASSIAGAINPTVYDEWTMDAEYEMIATAFGNDVQEAYDAMMEDINDQIDSYQANTTYNEWEHILEYNKTKGQITYGEIQSGSNVEDPLENGMPMDTAVYIGGYEGSITDSEWGVNGLGSGVDSASKTDSNFNKGLYKKDDPDTYATGKEVFFDSTATRESVEATCGYAAISDMAYIVSGYNVSRYEQPIYESDGSLSLFDVGLKVLAYKIDIARNIFASNVDNTGSLLGGVIQSVLDGIEDCLGVNTYFAYDPDEVKIVSATAKRRVYEYSEKIYTGVKDYKYTYSYSYNYDCQTSLGCSPSCPGHSGSCTASCPSGCTTDHSYTCSGCVYGCSGHSYNNTATRGPSHSDILNGYTHDSSFTTTQADYKPTASSLGIPSYATNVVINDGVKVESGDAYPLNRSEYKEVEKEYISYTLDIPTAPFDCDKLLKAMFEQSPYFRRQVVTSYVTDKDPKVTIKSDDEVIAAYGGYVWRWKYSAKDEDITFTDYTGSSRTQTVAEGDDVPNGIHAMPYRGSDLYYLYECTGHSSGTIVSLGFSDIVSIITETHSFGPDLQCPTCGAKMWETETDEISTDRKSTITGIGKYVLTTTDKLTLEDYTGEQSGGVYAAPSTVVLEQKNSSGVKVTDYYIITVLDRVLSNKDTVMNALENSEAMQAKWASVGNSAGAIYGGTIDYTPLIDYTAGKIMDASKYGSITINDGSYMIGIGNWKDDEAIEIVAKIYMENPSLLTSLCSSNGVTEEEFKSNWTNTTHADASKYKSIVQGLLNSSAGKTVQNEKFNEKVEDLITFWQSKGVSDGCTIVFLTALASYVDDSSKLSTGGGAYGLFRDYIVSPAIAAGVSDSLETAYNGYLSFCSLGSNLGLGNASIKSKMQTLHSTLVADRESGDVPFLFSGELTPENVMPLINNLRLYSTTYHDNIHYSQPKRYGQAGNTTIAQLSDMLLGLQSGSGAAVYCDCSSFAAANYYAFGYSVPITSSAWLSDTRFQARTDWANIVPGDVVRYNGHIEIYVGDGKTIGIGSEKNGVKERGMNIPGTPVQFFRVVQ